MVGQGDIFESPHHCSARVLNDARAALNHRLLDELWLSLLHGVVAEVEPDGADAAAEEPHERLHHLGVALHNGGARVHQEQVRHLIKLLNRRSELRDAVHPSDDKAHNCAEEIKNLGDLSIVELGAGEEEVCVNKEGAAEVLRQLKGALALEPCAYQLVNLGAVLRTISGLGDTCAQGGITYRPEVVEAPGETVADGELKLARVALVHRAESGNLVRAKAVCLQRHWVSLGEERR